MSDLISREALLKILAGCQSTKEFSHCAVQVLINSAPAIEQGEAVYLVKGSYGWIVTSKENYDCTDDNYKRVAYTAPQQPQEQGELVKKAVADALEDAAKICEGYERYYSDIAEIAEDASVQLPCLDKSSMAKECSEAIRTLIKRNAEYDKLSEVKP